MYTPTCFLIDDFLPIEIHNIYSDIEKIFLIDERVLRLSDIAYNCIQENFGATLIAINSPNYLGKSYNQEGLVIPNEKTIKLNQHHFGRAVHIKVKIFDVLGINERIEKYNSLRNILINENEFKYATIENVSYEYPNGLPYIHIDVRNNLTNSRFAREESEVNI